MRFIITLLLFLSLSLQSLLAQTVSAKKSTVTLKIGVILPLTGDFSFFGAQTRQGIEIASEELTQDRNLKIELIFEDDRCLPKDAVTAFTKLSSQDRVQMILGPGCTAGILSIAPAVNRLHYPVLALLDAGPAVGAAGETIFSLGYSSEGEGTTVAEHLMQIGTKSVAVIYETDQWAELVTRTFTKRFTALGGTITSELSQSPTDTDYKPNILRALSSQPTALYMAPAYNGGAFLKQLRQVNRNIDVYGPDTFSTEEVLDVAKSAAEGVIFANARFDESKPASKQLRDAINKRFGTEPRSLLYHSLGYDGLRIAVNALQNVKGSDLGAPSAQSRLIESLKSTHYTDGVLPNVTFDSSGLAQIPLQLFTVRDGAFVPVILR